VRKIAERFGVDPGTVQRIGRPRPFADGASHLFFRAVSAARRAAHTGHEAGGDTAGSVPSQRQDVWIARTKLTGADFFPDVIRVKQHFAFGHLFRLLHASTTTVGFVDGTRPAFAL
jgi:hypothetical protein